MSFLASLKARTSKNLQKTRLKDNCQSSKVAKSENCVDFDKAERYFQVWKRYKKSFRLIVIWINDVYSYVNLVIWKLYTHKFRSLLVVHSTLKTVKNENVETEMKKKKN